MGVDKLHADLKPAKEETKDVKRFLRGVVCGIDSNLWLRRALPGYVFEIYTTFNWTPLLNYYQDFTSRFCSNGSFPFCVFDGRVLPGKSPAHQERKAAQQKALSFVTALLGYFFPHAHPYHLSHITLV